ncbi:MAG: hypothetical protein ACLQLG_00120 [Thermoguttaceae bacterium]
MPWQFSIKSLLIFATVFAVFLSFFRVVGCANACWAIGPSLLIAGFTWALCWIAKDTRGRVRLLSVARDAALGAIIAGLICVYGNQLDLAKLDLSGIAKFWSQESHAFYDFAIFGGLVGAITGAFRSFLKHGPDVQRETPPGGESPDGPMGAAQHS